MKYSDLAKLLQELECQFRCTCSSSAPCAGHKKAPAVCSAPISFSGPIAVKAHIRPATLKNGGNCQFFALDSTTNHEDKDLPIVVAIGANYTQDNQKLPSAAQKRSVKNPPWIEDSLGTCRNNFIAGLTAYYSASQDWKDLAAAGINMPASIGTKLKPEDSKFHFVMTNFCPWITAQPNPSFVNSPATGNWDALSASVQAELLTNALSHQNSASDHLDDLLSELNGDENVYWCAHGLHSGVFPLFRMWQRSRTCGLGERWILLNNLSRRYGSYNKVFPFRNSK